MKKFIFIALAVALLTATLTGCDENPHQPAQEPTSDNSSDYSSSPAETTTEPLTTTQRPLTPQEIENLELERELEEHNSLTGSWINVITSAEELEMFTALKPWERAWIAERGQGTEADWLDKIEVYDESFFSEQYLVIVHRRTSCGDFVEVIRTEENGDIVVIQMSGNTLGTADYFFFLEFENSFTPVNGFGLAHVGIGFDVTENDDVTEFTVTQVSYVDRNGRGRSFTVDETIAEGMFTQEDFERFFAFRHG
jgi:hypothetical protein